MELDSTKRFDLIMCIITAYQSMMSRIIVRMVFFRERDFVRKEAFATVIEKFS